MERKEGNDKTAMNKGALAALYTVLLIGGAIGLIMVSSMILPGIGRVIRPGPGPGGAPPESDLAPFQDNLYLPLSLSLLNVALAVYILYIYVKDYLSIKSSFTLGMVVFLFSFLLYTLSSSPLLYMVLGPYGVAGELSFVPMLFSTICLLIFAKLSNE